MNKSRIVLVISAAVLVLALIVVGVYFISFNAGFNAGQNSEVSPTPPVETAGAMATPSAPVVSPPQTSEIKGTFDTKFYENTTTSELAPRAANEFCPDYTDYTEASPVTFGADKYEGRRVTVSNSELKAEIYLTAVDGGVWAVALIVPLNDSNNYMLDLQAQLAEWSVPENGS